MTRGRPMVACTTLTARFRVYACITDSESQNPLERASRQVASAPAGMPTVRRPQVEPCGPLVGDPPAPTEGHARRIQVPGALPVTPLQPVLHRRVGVPGPVLSVAVPVAPGHEEDGPGFRSHDLLVQPPGEGVHQRGALLPIERG